MSVSRRGRERVPTRLARAAALAAALALAARAGPLSAQTPGSGLAAGSAPAAPPPAPAHAPRAAPGARHPPAARAAARALWLFLDPYAVSNRLPPLASRAVLAERRHLGIPVRPGDRPIPERFLAAIRARDATLRTVSSWLRAVSVDADPDAERRLRALPWVLRVEPVAALVPAGADPRSVLAALAPRRPTVGRDGSVAPLPVAGRAPAHVPAARSPSLSELAAAPACNPAPPSPRSLPDSAYGPGLAALRDLGVPAAHVYGFTGKGVCVGMLDTGYDPAHQAVRTRTVVAERDFIQHDTVVANQPGDDVEQDDHGTATWALLGGYDPGHLIGPAFDAVFALAKTEDVAPDTIDGHPDEDRWVQGLQWLADSVGVRVVSSSLAYRIFPGQVFYPISELDGKTTPTSIAAEAAGQRGVVVVQAMGNVDKCGETTSCDRGVTDDRLWAPADAEHILSVGAADVNGTVASFSLRGPTGDGRVKPDLAAPGVGVNVPVAGTSGGYTTGSGTSYATPRVAAAAALFIQAWPDLSGSAVRQALRLSAPRTVPNNDVGYGIPDVSSAILFPQGLQADGVSSADLQGRLTTLAPTFTWKAPLVSPYIHPVHYTLELATDSTFTTVLYSDTASDASSLTVKQPLRPVAGIRWRVRAEAFPGIMRTTATAGPLTMPEWVTLLTLNDTRGSFTTSPRPELSWQPLAAPPPVGPLSYDVQVLDAATKQPVQRMQNVSGSRVTPPQPLQYNVPFLWRVIARTPSGVADTVTSVAPFVVTSNSKPPATLLYQNFPNPFPRADLGTSTTKIWFDLAEPSDVRLAVYDLHGRLVKQLIPSQPGCGTVHLDAGLFGRTGGSISDPCASTEWDGTDADGRTVPRGVYLLRLQTDQGSFVRRILFLPPDQ